MSDADALLVFIDERGEPEGWLQLAGADIVARGRALEGVPALVDPQSGSALKVAAVVPGEAVALHWLELPAGLTDAQAAAAARLVAAEVSLQPLDTMHVAVGADAGENALRPVALVPALAMAGWLGRLQADGLDPDLILPEPLLLVRPAEGFARYMRSAAPLYRGQADAFSIEPDLADLVVADAPVADISDELFESGLGAALAGPVVNLRQGIFAKRRRWTIEWPLVRRLAGLAAALLFVTLAIQLVLTFRYVFEADRLEAERARVAAAALPGISAANAADRLPLRLAELRGGGAGYSAIVSGLFAALQAVPAASLTAIAYEPDGALRATVQGETAAAIPLLQQQLEAAGLPAIAGPQRDAGGKPTAEITVRGR